MVIIWYLTAFVQCPITPPKIHTLHNPNCHFSHPFKLQAIDWVGTNQCSCNLTAYLDELKSDDVLREKLRGPTGPHGKEGKPGSPGLTVRPSTVNNRRQLQFLTFNYLAHRELLESLVNAALLDQRETVGTAVIQAPQVQRECRVKRGSPDWTVYLAFQDHRAPLEPRAYQRTMR